MSEMLYIRDPKMASRFLRDPFAERAWFSEGTLKVLPMSKKTVPEWADYFSAAHSESNTRVSGASEAQINSRLEFVEHAQHFTTPAKAAAFKLTTEEEEAAPTFSPFLDDSEVAMRQAWRTDSVLPEAMLNHIEKLGDAMDKVLEDSYKTQFRNLQQYQEIAGDFEKVKAWQQHCELRIGTGVPLFKRDFPSLWSALEFGFESLEQEDGIIQSDVEIAKSQIEQVERLVSIVEKELSDWKAAVAEGFKDVDAFLGKQFEMLDERIKEVKRKEAGSGPRIRNGVLFQPAQNGSDDGSEAVKGDGGDSGETLLDLRSRLRKLEGEIKRQGVGAGGSGEGPPMFGNLGLSSVPDLAAWNADQNSGFLFGLFVDAPALLTFKREDFISVSDQLAGLKRACDIGLNQVQVRVLASFQNTLPEFFGKGTESEGSSLPALPKLTDWEAEDGIHGAKFKLERSLPLIQKQLTTYIDTYLGENRAIARSLAHRCLSHSMLFVTRLSDYITRTARTLRLAGYKTDKVWSILSRQVLRIFEDMARARACAVDLSPPSSKGGVDSVFEDQNGALAMWAVLKTHDVMEEYLIHNFEDHPSIAAENVRFLTYNMMGAGGSNADVDAKQLEKQVDKLETSNKNLRTQLDKLGSRIEKLEKK
jgi:hypothetical protein